MAPVVLPGEQPEGLAGTRLGAGRTCHPTDYGLVGCRPRLRPIIPADGWCRRRPPLGYAPEGRFVFHVMITVMLGGIALSFILSDTNWTVAVILTIGFLVMAAILGFFT